jgi:C1A family cysteine protease
MTVLLRIIFSAAVLTAAPLPAMDDGRTPLAEIRAAIAAAGGNWAAGQTSVSELGFGDWRNLAALKERAPEDVPPPAPLSGVEPPAQLDWRSRGGNFVTPVRHQLKCGSCWAFSMAAALESYVMLKRGDPELQPDLSEQVFLACGGNGSCSGGMLDASFLVSTGLPPESAYPYAGINGFCGSAASGWRRTAQKIGSWGSVPLGLRELRAALYKYGPLPVAMNVYEDYMYYKSGVYTHASGKYVGGHAVTLIGYDDAGKYFIVKNSFGANWGEGGFFRIAYSELNSAVKFGRSAIAYRRTTAKDGPGPVYGGRPFDAEAAWGRAVPEFADFR